MMGYTVLAFKFHAKKMCCRSNPAGRRGRIRLGLSFGATETDSSSPVGILRLALEPCRKLSENDQTALMSPMMIISKKIDVSVAGSTTGRSQLVCPCLPSSINRCLRLVFGMAGWPHALPTPLNWNWVGPCWFRPKQAKKQLKLEGKKKEIVPRFRLRDPMLQPGVGIPSLTHF